MSKLYRQGDVFFRRIDALPEGERKKRADGAVAYGEATGHSHKLTAESMAAAEVLEIDGGIFVEVSDEGLRIAGLDGAIFDHEEHGPMRNVATGEIEALLAGTYEAWIQREYAPEGIRNVAD